MRNTTKMIAAATALATGIGVTAVITTTNTASAEGGCPNIQLIGVPGTHYYVTWSAPGQPNGLNPLQPNPFITDVSNLLGPERARGTIGYEQVVQPAEIGVLISYRESVKIGADMVRSRIADIAKRCGDTRFAIAGYSQGAGVAGDVLADIGQGRGPIPADKLSTGILFSDPHRTAADQLVGPRVKGVGVDGVRPGGFGAVHGRTFTFCGAGDLPCDNDPNATVLAPLAKEYSGTANVTFVQKVLKALQDNQFDLTKWSNHIGAPDPITAGIRIAGTAAAVEAYNRENRHGVYADKGRLNINGQTAVEWAANRIRDDLGGASAGGPPLSQGDGTSTSPTQDPGVAGFTLFQALVKGVTAGKPLRENLDGVGVHAPQEKLTTLVANALVKRDPQLTQDAVVKAMHAAADFGDIVLAVDPNELNRFAEGVAKVSAGGAALGAAPTPQALLQTVQGAGLLTSSGLAILSDGLRMYEAGANLPQIADVLDVLDPNTPDGALIYSQLPEQARTPQMLAAMTTLANVGRALNKVDKYEIMAIGREFGDLAAAGDPMGLVRVPHLLMRSVVMAGEVLNALRGANLGDLGAVAKAVAPGR
ncbi:cutinase [Herbihabitans rhizosphaerae]|uniref:Cutinase n=1 Tax=Herbihabitans rhizosphaerae TaxID=1872711 RepID=A0A4Q7KCD1_9PSEU|nr:cutinase family protein [Herbihabitans rhizosphaerae]RZS31128.1 cutinase [Herbihabitans rhizosphaerae]